ncbi:hypothetical protein ACFWE5_07320 [Cellulosimicrobium funkei]|uniref:hypothetical protein n=1 Tax=Cellulosimicrobium funkei TaxID=264251 RepID=UPI003646361F
MSAPTTWEEIPASFVAEPGRGESFVGEQVEVTLAPVAGSGPAVTYRGGLSDVVLRRRDDVVLELGLHDDGAGCAAVVKVRNPFVELWLGGDVVVIPPHHLVRVQPTPTRVEAERDQPTT